MFLGVTRKNMPFRNCLAVDPKQRRKERCDNHALAGTRYCEAKRGNDSISSRLPRLNSKNLNDWRVGYDMDAGGVDFWPLKNGLRRVAIHGASCCLLKRVRDRCPALGVCWPMKRRDGLQVRTGNPARSGAKTLVLKLVKPPMGPTAAKCPTNFFEVQQQLFRKDENHIHRTWSAATTFKISI